MWRRRVRENHQLHRTRATLAPKRVARKPILSARISPAARPGHANPLLPGQLGLRRVGTDGLFFHESPSSGLRPPSPRRTGRRRGWRERPQILGIRLAPDTGCHSLAPSDGERARVGGLSAGSWSQRVSGFRRWRLRMNPPRSTQRGSRAALPRRRTRFMAPKRARKVMGASPAPASDGSARLCPKRACQSPEMADTFRRTETEQ
jgi:hypothetical protein